MIRILKKNYKLTILMSIISILLVIGIAFENKLIGYQYIKHTDFALILILKKIYGKIILPNDLLGLQFTVSLAVITAASALFKLVDYRILDISVKNWLFHDILFFFNFPNTVISILILNIHMFISIIFKSKVCSICIFLFTYICTIRLIWLAYILCSKKSELYLRIAAILGRKREDKNRQRLNEMLVKKWKNNYTWRASDKAEDSKKKHNSYILEEIFIIYLMKDEFNFANERILSLIKDDNRASDAILSHFLEDDKLPIFIDFASQNGTYQIDKYSFIEWFKLILEECNIST